VSVSSEERVRDPRLKRLAEIRTVVSPRLRRDTWWTRRRGQFRSDHIYEKLVKINQSQSKLNVRCISSLDHLFDHFELEAFKGNCQLDYFVDMSEIGRTNGNDAGIDRGWGIMIVEQKTLRAAWNKSEGGIFALQPEDFLCIALPRRRTTNPGQIFRASGF